MKEASLCDHNMVAFRSLLDDRLYPPFQNFSSAAVRISGWYFKSRCHC